MKIAIVGSRSISSINFNDYISERPECIISGGAKGIDQLAEAYAASMDIPVFVLKPDYNTFGRIATFKRNEQIIKECDKVFAFWDGRSKGTMHSIKMARKHNKPVELVVINSD